MIHTDKAVRTLQAVAMTVGIAVFLWSTGLPTLFPFAEAASITNASDTLSSSAPSSPSNHTLVFTLPNGMGVNDTMEVTFAAGFALGSVGENDVDIDVNGSASSTDAAAGVDTWGVGVSGQTITFTAPDNQGVASSSEITIRVGTHAGTSGTGANQITNPSATTSHTITIGEGASTMQDSGEVRVAIIDEVDVTASVDSSLTFSVAGVDATETVNSSPTTTVATTTATTLPFGSLSADTSRTLAHDLTVNTNAANGYSVTVALSGTLQSSTGAVIDSFIDGGDTAVPTAWTSPSEVLSDDTTYGHWGITSDDATTTRASEFGADEWTGIATSSPTTVMGHTGPADGTTAGVGTARVGYQVQISALQEAGDDYNTTLRYIATPTF